MFDAHPAVLIGQLHVRLIELSIIYDYTVNIENCFNM
jgi:hypothetical protein